jgi:hypothetical protein
VSKQTKTKNPNTAFAEAFRALDRTIGHADPVNAASRLALALYQVRHSGENGLSAELVADYIDADLVESLIDWLSGVQQAQGGVRQPSDEDEAAA